MSLISYAFLLLFLPLSLAGYWLVTRHPRQKLVFLCVVSYVFYALSGWQFVWVLLGLSLATFLLAQRPRLIGLAIVLNLGALALFKYWDFGLAHLTVWLSAIKLPFVISTLKLALPLGISFYVFKHLGYLLDVRRQRYPPTRDFWLFTTYAAFFPQISAGPLSGFQDTGAQLAVLPEYLEAENVHQGLIHLSVGLAKKLLIADVLGVGLESLMLAVTQPGALASGGSLLAWSLVILFALQLYFDFSGYSDIALGIGYLFGVRLPRNFNNPYLAQSASDFWQRWHISLSNWFRLYLFSPLSRTLLSWMGSNRSGWAQFIANMITMGLIGLWHSSNWTFILWGLYHGLLLNIYALLGQRARALSRLLIIPAILLGWALFLSPDLAFAQTLVQAMFGGSGFGRLETLASLFTPLVGLTMILATLIALSGFSEGADLAAFHKPVQVFFFGVLVVLCLLHLGSVREFVYIQF